MERLVYATRLTFMIQVAVYKFGTQEAASALVKTKQAWSHIKTPNQCVLDHAEANLKTPIISDVPYTAYES